MALWRKRLMFAQTPIEWESVDVTPILKDGKTTIPDTAINSVQKNLVALKGPLAVGFFFPFLFFSIN